MSKMLAKYDKAVEKVEGRLVGLRKENERDQAKAVELEKAYELSVIEGDGESVTARKKLVAVKEAIAERTEQIELLEAGEHPHIIQAANELVADYVKEKEKIRKRVVAVNAAAFKAKQAFLIECVKSNQVEKEFKSLLSAVQHVIKKADIEVIEDAEITLDVTERPSNVGMGTVPFSSEIHHNAAVVYERTGEVR